MNGSPRRVLTTSASICVLVFLSGVASAQQVFTDRDAFLRAAGPVNFIDFEEVNVGPSGVVPITGREWADRGLTFQATRAGATLAIGGGGGVDRNLFVNEQEDSDVTTALTAPVRAFGLTIFDNTFHTTAERVVFLDAAGALLADVEMPRTPDADWAFVGLVTPSPVIARVLTREDSEGDFVGIGEVIVPVPEPGAAALAVAGLAALLVRRRPA